jgi:formylglycine-generating enzyme required for sulfatase activity
MMASARLLLAILGFVSSICTQSWAAPAVGTVWTEPTTGMEFAWIPGGCFQMGSDESLTAKPRHNVCVSGFWLGRHEVTQKEYERVAGHNPSYFKGGERPVEQVDWDEANAFAIQLGRTSGHFMRLPSEAEWEYACRAGGQHEIYCGEGQISDLGWFGRNSYTQTHPVGQKLANGWGTYDMSGNVWEWAQDCWHANYSGAPTDGSAWTGTGNCRQRVARGGGWFDSSPFLQATYRNKYEASSRYFYLGFRLIMKHEEDIVR